MDTKTFVTEANTTPYKACNVCGGPVKVDRTHVRRECLLFALQFLKEERERREELEVCAAAMYLGHDDGNKQFDMYRAVYLVPKGKCCVHPAWLRLANGHCGYDSGKGLCDCKDHCPEGVKEGSDL